MMVMLNSSGWKLGWYAGRYPGRIGYLCGPARPITYWMPIPVAVDNGAFAAWEKKKEYEIEPFWYQLDRLKLAGMKPLWAIVPDVVSDAQKTLDNWHKYVDKVAKYAPPAIAVQDGMTPSDVPCNAEIVFVGGTTEWKWRNAESFCRKFKTHIGRVNTRKRITAAERVGAVSVDGTGWFRGGKEREEQLEAFLNGTYKNQMEMNL